MRITKLCCQVEPEVFVVVDNRVTYLDRIAVSTLDNLLLQQRFNGGVELFADVLNHNGIALAY